MTSKDSRLTKTDSKCHFGIERASLEDINESCYKLNKTEIIKESKRCKKLLKTKSFHSISKKKPIVFKNINLDQENDTKLMNSKSTANICFKESKELHSHADEAF